MRKINKYTQKSTLEHETGGRRQGENMTRGEKGEGILSYSHDTVQVNIDAFTRSNTRQKADKSTTNDRACPVFLLFFLYNLTPQFRSTRTTTTTNQQKKQHGVFADSVSSLSSICTLDFQC